MIETVFEKNAFEENFEFLVWSIAYPILGFLMYSQQETVAGCR